jgi:hypothetical protein
MSKHSYSFNQIIQGALDKTLLTDLNEKELGILNLLTLLVDIEYERTSAASIDELTATSYSYGMVQNKVLPDQKSPADTVLEGSQREIFE